MSMMNNTSPQKGPGSPSKEPLMSPARGVGRGGGVPRAEQPSPVHGRTNVSYKCLTPNSTPGSSPLHTANSSTGTAAEQKALLKSDEKEDGGKNAHMEQLSSSDLNHKLDKVAWQSLCSSQYKSPTTASGNGSVGGGSGAIKKTRSDTILSLFTRKGANNIDRQTKSTSALPAGAPKPGSRTGVVRRHVWSGEQMRADMVDLSELYANPNTLLSFGVLTITVGCVSLALSLSSKGMRLWFNVGCIALGIGVVLLSAGGAWHYLTSKLIYVAKPDVEIKVVSGTEGTHTATHQEKDGTGV